jgi:hypothetical protein
MTDTHVRILRLIAEQRRRALSDHDAAKRAWRAPSGPRRRRLHRAVTRTTVQVAQAEARRRGLSPPAG